MCIGLWANYEETPTVALGFDVSFGELNESNLPNHGASSSIQSSNKG
jgi:hypothetical protein